MKRFLNFTLPKYLVILGWILLCLEWLMIRLFESSMGQGYFSSVAVFIFASGAAPILLRVLRSLPEESSG
jgi:hypothetical protein